MKLNVTKIISIVGLALSVVGTIASGVASDRKMTAAIEKAVDEKLKKI